MKHKNILLSIGGLLILAVVLSFFTGFIQALRIIFGSIFVLFLPGLMATYIFFKKIDVIERITLSFALSIAVVPLLLFYLNKIGLKINTLNSFIVISAIIAILLIILKIKRK